MTVPFALSIHNFVNSVGSYVGFASIVAVAILILLYFAHSRETATLRERLDEAQQRISGLEARIGQLMQLQQRGRPAGPGPVAPAPVAPPVPVRPAGAPQGSVRRVPNPATAAAAASAPPPAAPAPAAAQPRAKTPIPAAPAGVAGPALASATRVIPESGGAPDDTMFVPAAAAATAAAAANGKAQGERTAVLEAAPAAALSARAASASPRGAVAAPPRMQIAAEEEPATAAVSSGGAAKVRRIGGHPKPSVVSLPAFDEDSSGGGRLSGAVLPLLIAGAAVIVIIAGLIVISNSGGGATSGNVSHNNTANTTGQSLHARSGSPAQFNAADVTIAVLNGTAQQGLAGDVGKKLIRDGYRQGNVTNAASQTESSTFVFFVPAGRATTANRTAAQHVAKALALPPSRVRRADAGVIQSCKISATGASLSSCKANVIVSVGQDRVNLASSG